MKWSDKPPTKPGWYWLRIPPHGIPQIVQVEHDEYCNYMVIWLAGSECDEPLHKQPSSAQWAGPIPEPEEK